MPLRQGRDALQGTWIEYAVERDGKRTCASSFFTSLAVSADNAERIARAGRARWKIENEGFNCLARHGRNCKRNFGHGKDGPTGLADAAGGGARRTRASGLPGGRATGAWTPRSFVPAASGQRPAVKAGYRRSASGRGLGTRRTRDAGRATALPAVRPSRGAASGAQPLGQLIHLILRNNLHAPP